MMRVVTGESIELMQEVPLKGLGESELEILVSREQMFMPPSADNHSYATESAGQCKNGRFSLPLQCI